MFTIDFAKILAIADRQEKVEDFEIKLNDVLTVDSEQPVSFLEKVQVHYVMYKGNFVHYVPMINAIRINGKQFNVINVPNDYRLAGFDRGPLDNEQGQATLYCGFKEQQYKINAEKDDKEIVLTDRNGKKITLREMFGRIIGQSMLGEMLKNVSQEEQKK